MAVTIQIPIELELALRQQDPHLDTHSRDQFLVANYQAGRLSTGDLALALGFETRSQAESWLGARGVSLNYSIDDADADQRTLDRLLGPAHP